MASWVRWTPQNIYVPCKSCNSGDSVFWPSRLASRTDSNDEHGRPLDTRRNDECPHEQYSLSYFTKTSESDPRAEWLNIDWDPPAST